MVFTANRAKAQSFTADPSRLLAAISAMRGGNVLNHDPEIAALTDPMYFTGAVRTISQSVEVLLGAPQGRKTLVLISTGVPQDPGGGATGLEDYATLYSLQYLKNGQAAMRQAADYATRARDFLVDQANSTGGRAVVGTADASAGVTQMFRESSTYYLIGFQSADAKAGRRRLDIRTSIPGVTLQTRHSFEVAAPSQKNKARPVNPLVKAITGVVPEGSLPMRVSAVPLAAPNGSGGIVAITLGIHQPAGVERTTEKVEVLVNANKPDGHFVTSTRLDAKLVLRGSESGGTQYEFLANLSLPPGRYQL